MVLSKTASTGSGRSSKPQQRCGLRTIVVRTLVVFGFVALWREIFWQEESSLLSQFRAGVQPTDRMPNLDSIAFVGTDSNTPVLHLRDMKDLAAEISPRNSFFGPKNKGEWDMETILRDREHVLQILERAGLLVDVDVMKLLPAWSDVKQLYGAKPVVLGMERCAAFRKRNPPERRFVGISGQFNTGTNALAIKYFANLKIPSNPKGGHGMRSFVPWHKHGWVAMRSNYMFDKDITDHESVLPVVVIRDPYFWMESMCESPYLLNWEHSHSAFKGRHCPNLVTDKNHSQGVPANVLWGTTWNRTWESLASVWTEWYREYYDADFPRLMIRFEDLLFHTPEVLDQIRECAGAEWKESHFVFSTSPSKTTQYFEKIKPQSSMLSAVIKYGKDCGRRTRYMNPPDLSWALEKLDPVLMDAFHYIHPNKERNEKSCS